MKKILNNVIIAVFISTIFYSCIRETEKEPVKPPTPIIPNLEALKWGEMTLKIMYKQVANTPTYGSRSLAYMGLTMYETVVNGNTKYKSMAGQLTDLPTLPKPDVGKEINWALALNAGQAFMLKNLYNYAEKSKLDRIDSLETSIRESYATKVSQTITDQSVKYGKEVAEAIWNWSKSDGGFEGYKKNFDANYKVPKGPGYWVPPVRGQVVSEYPLHSFWGKNRTFSPTNGQLPVPNFITYSTDKASNYFSLINPVYLKSLTLTQTEKEIAAWWADDPSETFSPPGHSYSLANIVVNQSNVDLFKAAETYARVGMAVADAFINCWKTKFTYHSERPGTYIRATIKNDWIQIWPEPPFPAFYSGHSTQAAASSAVLTFLYGPTYQFTDVSHVGRHIDEERKIEFKARKYNSFDDAAREAGYSRILGGIHTSLDNEVGYAEGVKAGENVNKLIWRN